MFTCLEEIGGYRGTFVSTYTIRVNYDCTLSPNLLLHVGAGYFHTRFSDKAPNLSFNPASLGLSNFLIDRQFPSFTGMCGSVPAPGATGCGGFLGGMQTVGTSGQIQSLNFEEKPTFNTNLTWIKGQHTFKAGAEVYIEQVYTGSFAGVTFATGTAATSEPYTPQGGLNGNSMGFGFASFLLGDYGATSATGTQTSIAQTPQLNYREGSQEWGLYLQDTLESDPQPCPELWPSVGLLDARARAAQSPRTVQPDNAERQRGVSRAQQSTPIPVTARSTRRPMASRSPPKVRCCLPDRR